MKVNIKKLRENAVIPSYAHITDAGMDITATSLEIDGSNFIYGTGLAFEVPKGYVMLLFSRSSVRNTQGILTNCIGVIDSKLLIIIF